MPKMSPRTTRVTTPVDVVQKTNPLIKGIAEVSRKWHKRWPDIDQPWPVEGTLNLEVIKTMQVLVSTYKTKENKGGKGQKRREKRRTELGILELFKHEGQKWIMTSKAKKETLAEELGRNLEVTEKLLAEANKPFSHTAQVKCPPPYEKEVKFSDVYPQLPVLSQKGSYQVTDDWDRVMESGKAITTIELQPSPSRGRKKGRPEKRDDRRSRRMEIRSTSDSEAEGAQGGYGSIIKHILAKAEKKGNISSKKTAWRDNDTSESETKESDWENEGDDDENHDQAQVKESKQRGNTEQSKSQVAREVLDLILEELELDDTEQGRERSHRESTPRYSLRRTTRERSNKMLPVVVRGQSLEYKPWQNTDMSHIIEKLPIIQEGAHPFSQHPWSPSHGGNLGESRIEPICGDSCQ